MVVEGEGEETEEEADGLIGTENLNVEKRGDDDGIAESVKSAEMGGKNVEVRR